jgi:anti-anti-sigma factor
VVLHLEGRLTLEADTHQLHELVRSIVRFGPCNVVLDLGNVWQLDCSGIGQLVQLRNRVCGSGGVFTLVNVERRQKRLLQILGLLAVLPVFDSRQEAIMGCRSAAAAARGLPSARLEASTDAERPSIDDVFQQAL